MSFFAHTLLNKGPEYWQFLEDHLQNVADKAGDHATVFHAETWGQIIGQLHDIGKYRPEFQKKLLSQSNVHVDHKSVGAKIAAERFGPLGILPAFCIAGHHGGLPNRNPGSELTASPSLADLLSKAATLPDDILDPLTEMELPPFPIETTPDLQGFQASFFVRMLYSALVDADFLDTEHFVDPHKYAERLPGGPSLSSLQDALNTRLTSFQTDTPINKLRSDILAHCRGNAHLEPGLFTLTVPTGGGKTLTSMSFALDHALRHGLRRIIYVIPYTSIIEQNAKVFREIFPEGTVIEHHSTFDEDMLRSDARQQGADQIGAALRHRLATENWDAPVIVTTNVQFFESLFAAKPSRCRKLHNVAGSVLILDEAQMLPVPFLDPCLRALEELAHNYGCSIVLCTATQPALGRRKDFSIGLTNLREIAPDPQKTHVPFVRTRLEDAGTKSLPKVAEMIRERPQVLCIVNTRKRAGMLFDHIRDCEGSYHLSALMCPAHRKKILEDIRQALRQGQPCRVVSTQLIEAGVDISFPEVIREIAGLDSIVQAAGRCNREGSTDTPGIVHVFAPEEGVVPGFSQAAGNTRSILRRFDDPFAPEAIWDYFANTYWLSQDKLDAKSILKDFKSRSGNWAFRDAAHKFKLIDSQMVPIIIPYSADPLRNEAENLLRALPYADHPGGILRRLQPFIVQVYPWQFTALHHAIEWIDDTYPALCDTDRYDETIGLRVEDAGPPDENYIF
jgi:CRISPR-associated endonuclease/helicase Cas3